MNATDCPRCGTRLDVEAGYCEHCAEWTAAPHHVPDLADPERFLGGRIVLVVDDELAGIEPPC